MTGHHNQTWIHIYINNKHCTIAEIQCSRNHIFIIFNTNIIQYIRCFQENFMVLKEISQGKQQLGNLLRMRQISIESLKLEDFPEEITKCSSLLYIFECLFNLYNFFARDKDKVKCTLRFQCIEYLVCA